MLDTHICGSCVTPFDERVVLLATAATALRCLGGELDEELYALSDRIGEEYARQLDRNRERCAGSWRSDAAPSPA